jgi:LacI family transcriptional regulator
MKTTIRDVAEAIGVSATTVGAVLNSTRDNVNVATEKAERVGYAARDLRDLANPLGRPSRAKRTGTVGVVLHNFDGLSDAQPYYPQLLSGVMAELFPSHYTMALCPGLSKGSRRSSMSDGRFDGVLWCQPDFTETSLADIKKSKVPVVMMHAPPNSVSGIPTYCADNGRAMEAAVRHLTELGHDRIAFVIDLNNEHTVEGRARREAFVAATRNAGIREGEVLVWDPVRFGVSRYGRQGAPHTALVCFSDTVANSVLTACSQLGISVPRDLSVIGFDSSSFCERTQPRLTSLHQPVERMARAATTHLLRLIRDSVEGSPSPTTVSFIYDCALDIRESTALRTH